jgi:gliding motility-associated-like protein
LQVVFNNKSTNAYEFDWYIEGNVLHDKNPVYIFTKPGIYSVTLRVKGPGGSDDTTKTDYITVEAQPRANFRVNPKEVFLPDAYVDLLNLSTDAVKFYWYILDKSGNTVWSDTTENPRGLVKDTGFYHVKLIAVNAKGCFDTMTILNAFSAFAEGEIYVPTAFTPDRNGLNDVFKPAYYGLQSQDYRFIIFNRWGEVVFETTDRDAAWDGKFKGMPAQQDVYAWLLKGTLAGNKRVVLNGTVTLLH